MNKEVLIIIYTKEEGKLELSQEEFLARTSELSQSSFHRLYGPAIEYSDGSKSWYINDKPLTEEEFDTIIDEIKSLPLELRLTDPRWWVREFVPEIDNLHKGDK